MAALTRSKLAVWIARHLLAAGLTLTGILLLLGYAFVFRLQIADIRNADRVNALREEAEAKKTYLQQLSDLQAQYDSFAPEERDRLYQIIPRDEDVPGILTILEAAATSSDAQLTAVNFSAGDVTGLTGVPGIATVNISISIQHMDYARFKLFLAALESNLRLFDVRSANIDPNNANYSLTIRAYVRSAPVPAAGAAPAIGLPETPTL